MKLRTAAPRSKKIKLFLESAVFIQKLSASHDVIFRKNFSPAQTFVRLF